MSWSHKLYETYENNINVPEKPNVEPLPMISHGYLNAQIEVTLSAHGKFLDARQLSDKEDKENLATLIPMNMESASRSNNVAPHALVDQLQYIAGDFEEYGGKIKKDKKYNGFDMYMKQFSDWCQWENARPEIWAVYDYLQKKCLTKDLIEQKILMVDESGKLEKKSINQTPYEKCVVRFIVLGDDLTVDVQLWKNKAVQENYVEYYENTSDFPVHLCMVTGKFAPASRLHPKGILPFAHKAKLIASNDTESFTYIGRFCTPEEAMNVSYDASQKIHLTLIWLVKNVGIRLADSNRVYVYWNPHARIEINNYGTMVVKGSSISEQDKQTLKSLLMNSLKQINTQEEYVIMGLELASQSQIAIVEYYELSAQELTDLTKTWCDTCRWYFWVDKKLVIDTPDLMTIANVLYGYENEEGWLRINKKIVGNIVSQLQACMLYGRPMPMHFARQAFIVATHANTSHPKKRMLCLAVACAVINKYRIDNRQGAYDMKLDVQCKDRSYLCGRLLAIYDMIEARVLRKKHIDRPTNAQKLQAAFVQTPGLVLKNLDTMATPYLNSMSAGTRTYYQNLISDIYAALDDNAMKERNLPLSDGYLFGYYLQRQALYSKKKSKKTNHH